MSERGGYASGNKPVSAMKLPPAGPASGGACGEHLRVHLTLRDPRDVLKVASAFGVFGHEVTLGDTNELIITTLK